MTIQRKLENYKVVRTYKYIVNEKKRTVVCLIYVKDEPFVTEYCDGCRVFRGIAKCNDNDEFKEEFGKELAKKRALKELTDFELRNIRIEYPEVRNNKISEVYEMMQRAMERREFLEKQLVYLRDEIYVMIC